MNHINLQLIEKPDQVAGSLDIIDVWNTIQGEGPLAGMPATFVRLAGCNLQCPLCDTDYTTDRYPVSVKALVDRIEENHAPGRLIVLTGGEPFRQRIDPFVNVLLYRKFIVQIETNGTLFTCEGLNWDNLNLHVVCSPKTPGVPRKLADKITAWKYIVEYGKVDPTDGLPTSVLGAAIRPYRPMEGVRKQDIYIQPCDAGPGNDEQTNLNIRQALDVCAAFGYRICLQLHKILGMK